MRFFLRKNKLTFNSLHLNTFYKVFLAEEENNQYRNCHNEGNCHHLTDLCCSHRRVQELDTDCNGKLFGGIKINSRLVEIIPVKYKRHNAYTHGNRFYSRKHDMDKCLEGICTVNHRRFI